MSYKGNARPRRPQKYRPNLQKALGLTTKKKLEYAYVTAKLLKGIVNAELRVDDTTGSLTLSNSWQVVPLTQIAQGDDYTNREGRSILSKSLWSILKLKSNTSSIVPQNVGIVIFQDRWQSGSTPAGTDLYTSNDPESLRLVTGNQSRYKILYRRNVSLKPAAGSISGETLGGYSDPTLKRFIRTNFHIKYIGTTDAAASNGRNNLYLMAISDASGNYAALEYQIRHRFYDN